MAPLLTRRSVLTGLGFSAIIGGTAGLAFSPNFRELVLGTGEKLAYKTYRTIGRNTLAPEFTEADLSPISAPTAIRCRNLTTISAIWTADFPTGR